MKPFRTSWNRSALSLLAIVSVFNGAADGLLAACGPFTDVAVDAFCPLVLEIFYLGITTGTTPATYDPSSPVSRLQMAAFLSRSVDSTLKRRSRRTAMGQLWTPRNVSLLGMTTVGIFPRILQCDGADVWVGNSSDNSISRVRGSDGKLLDTWTGAGSVYGVALAMNRVFGAAQLNPGRLYLLDPAMPAGAVTTVASNLGVFPVALAFDGDHFWTANEGPAGSISIVTPSATIPWPATTLTIGIGNSQPIGLVFDGANVWATDLGLSTLVKLDAAGTVLQTVTVGAKPSFPGFDGTSIWVPNFDSSSVTVVRASNGAVLQTLTGNGLDHPAAAGFDGERVLVTNISGNSVSLWKAADLTPLGFFPTGANSNPEGVCSDGANFWVALQNTRAVARF